ncbi:MAG: response regulator, partial [bacterium]|nr:response regulator [bacterium]
PDLLLLDIMMPDIDGFELLRRIRRHPKLEEIPVIVISAQASTLDHQRMLRLRQPIDEMIDAYLGKPFDPARLLQTVKDVLVKHRDYLIEKNRAPERPWEKHQVFQS